MLHDTIKRLRQERGLSQQALAQQLHVVRQTISKWETGLSVPDAQQFLRLAEVLEVSVGQLLEQPTDDREPDSLRQQLRQREAELSRLQLRRSRQLRWGGIILLLLSLLPLLLTALPFLVESLSLPANAIGGADGPTSVFIVTRGYHPNWTMPILLFALLAIPGLWLLRKGRQPKKDHVSRRTP